MISVQPVTSPMTFTGTAASALRSLSSLMRTPPPGSAAKCDLRACISSSSSVPIFFSISSLRCGPETAVTMSRSQIATVRPVVLAIVSQSCSANGVNSPTGEYFLKITSPSRFVNISIGSPSRIRRTRRISFGMTTRPRSSILLTIPVAFMSVSFILL